MKNQEKTNQYHMENDLIDTQQITLYEHLKKDFSSFPSIDNHSVKSMSQRFIQSIKRYDSNILIQQMIKNGNDLVNENMLNPKNLDSMLMYMGNVSELSKTAQENLKYLSNNSVFETNKIKEELKYIQNVFKYAQKELS